MTAVIKKGLLPGLFLLSYAVASAAPLGIYSNSLTMLTLVDGSANILAIDIHGSIGLSTAAGATLVTDAFSPPDFGNLTLAGVNNPFDGTAALLTFNPGTAFVAPGGTPIFIQSTGVPLLSPLSSAEEIISQTLTWTFDLQNVQLIPDSPNALVQYSVSAVDAPSNVPEPSSLVFAGLGLAAVLVHGARRRMAA